MRPTYSGGVAPRAEVVSAVPCEWPARRRRRHRQSLPAMRKRCIFPSAPLVKPPCFIDIGAATTSHASNRPDLVSLRFLKQVLETNQDRGRQPKHPLLRLVESRHLDRNSSSGWKRIGNNVKSLAIHANVVGRTVAEAFNPSAVV